MREHTKDLLGILAAAALGFCMGYSPACHAQETTTVGINLASVHVPAHDGQNNTNPGLYIIAGHAAAGTYYNTLRRQSVWGAYHDEWRQIDWMAGLVTGYQKHYTGDGDRYVGSCRYALMPFIAVSWRVPVEVLTMHPRLTVMPGTSFVVNASVEKNF